MSLLKIEQLFNYEKGSLQSSKCEPGKYNFITAAFEWKTHKSYSHDCEALVFAAAASGSLGRIHYVKGKFTASDLCFILTPKDNSNLPIDLKFYHIIFNLLRNDIVKNTKAGTSKEAIGLTRFGQYKLPYFDIEQQALVKEQFGKIEELKTSISNENFHQLNLISQIRQAFLREAMQGKLVAQDKNDEPASELLKRIKAAKEKLIAEGKIKKQKPLPEIKPEEIPYGLTESWIWCRLGEIVLSMNNGIYKPEQFYNEEGIACLRMYNIQNGIISNHNLKRMILTNDEIETYSLTEGDLLINRVNSIELLGKAAYIKKLEEVTVYESKNIRVHFTFNDVIPKFINFLFLTNIIHDQVLKKFKKVTGQASINQVQLSLLNIPLPPLAEQKRIVTKLEQIMQLCSELEKNINQSKEETNLLLQTVLREAIEEKENKHLRYFAHFAVKKKNINR